MPIPPEILAVKRPKSTRVKKSGNRWLVIKRTCCREGSRNIPVELGTIGEIVDGRYVEIRKEPRSSQIDIKDYGEVKLCMDCAGDMLENLASVWIMTDAKKFLCIAVLRAAYGPIRNRDLKLQYDTSYLSEMIPKVAMSVNSVSRLLMSVGKQHSLITEFMNKHFGSHSVETVMVDGMLKNSGSISSSISELEIEARFTQYGNIIDRGTVNEDADNLLYATEFINFLTVIIVTRVRKKLIETAVNKKYTLEQVFNYLSKIKKVRIGVGGKWRDSTTVSYIADLAKTLGVIY